MGSGHQEQATAPVRAISSLPDRVGQDRSATIFVEAEEPRGRWGRLYRERGILDVINRRDAAFRLFELFAQFFEERPGDVVGLIPYAGLLLHLLVAVIRSSRP